MKANCVSVVHVHTHAVHMCQVCIISTVCYNIIVVYTHRLAYNYTVEPLNKGHHWDPDYPYRESVPNSEVDLYTALCGPRHVKWVNFAIHYDAWCRVTCVQQCCWVVGHTRVSAVCGNPNSVNSVMSHHVTLNLSTS